MDKSVPEGAAMLLRLIQAPPEDYEAIIGFRQGQLQKPLTQMTVQEVLAAQKFWIRNWRGSAAGAYQITNKTLGSLVNKMRVSPILKFDGDLQDRLAHQLLRDRGYDAFAAGRLTDLAFGLALAKEWASFPVLAAVRGQKRDLVRGQSFYAGDGLNKATITPEQVEAALAKAR